MKSQNKIISFNKLPICDIVKLINYFNLNDNQIERFFNKSKEDINIIRYMVAEGFGRKSLIQNEEDYREYVEDVKSFDNSSQKKSKRDKIANAFKNIPNDFTNAITVAESYGVSLATLRQSKRFDPFQSSGKVVFKTISGIIMVKREIHFNG